MHRGKGPRGVPLPTVEMPGVSQNWRSKAWASLRASEGAELHQKLGGETAVRENHLVELYY